MKKIQALHQYLLTLGITTPKQLDSYVDMLKSKSAGRPLECDSDKVVISECTYTARFFITGYPFIRYPIAWLSASIDAWLLDVDDERKDLPETIINIDVNDKNGAKGDTADLEFEVIFDELIVIEPNENGLISYQDHRCSIV